ncbi:type I methionyl aminopeptidase [Aquiflexum lacus]|uniref:type I methionyl aminopeptidase n=1 Tax=Aquiflexum lacus TaxID=2483805 RepID=UPI00189528FD|nr:type I methionyl aminopeptidase [Aquiflexum lacus]
MIHYKTSEEVQIIKEGAQILGKAHGEVAKYVKEGVKTSFLDKVAEEYIRDFSGVPSFKGYNGFPSSLCISVNEVIVHGFPSNYVLKDGDIISVDCGVFHQGFHSDSAYTYPVGEVSPQVLSLLKTTKASLYLGIESAVFGNRIGDIGFAIQKFVEAKGYTVVRELVGHGLGKNLHEAPEVPNYGKKGSGPLMKDGLVIAIEPMINLGTRNIVQERDGWTIRTADRKASAHYEHTVAIFEDRTEILTTHQYIEENFKF